MSLDKLKLVGVMLSEDDIKAIDVARGYETTSSFLRRIIKIGMDHFD